jgi:hypothetical protein
VATSGVFIGTLLGLGSEDVRGRKKKKKNPAGRIIGENVTSRCWRRNRGEAKIIIINLKTSVPTE